ncbi:MULTISPECIES: tryptophan synthase subunit alpha [Allobacillus]|uniref:Tryptophan synthase alpha chain n=1 Tax=Allobacillus salarius TaxID=1955272 RepID=A0A556PKP9_9BACI|nr:tryptophan synthase subunit alpha [Allobacillus salarius]TSJ64957.1 tryptophan synthase subunit alpha [Allobacillus salarius]
MGKLKIDEAIGHVLRNGDKAFVPYIMAGDGGLDQLESQIQLLADAGATVIELGIPFSDPVADGPTIQESGQRALKNGVTLRKVLNELKRFKQDREIPVVLMTYINPIYAYGPKQFAEDCEASGVDGVIIPDIPLEETDHVAEALKEHEIAFIRLASLTSTPERLAKISEQTEGFLYAVTVNGITGTHNGFGESLGDHLSNMRKLTNNPIFAGFGVSSPEHVRELTEHCDGVIVGSKIVDLLHNDNEDEIRTLIQSAKITHV